MSAACLGSTLLIFAITAHSPFPPPGDCNGYRHLWDGYCSGDNCQHRCHGGRCGQGCTSGGQGTCQQQVAAPAVAADDCCPNCGVSGAMCAGGCRACGSSFGQAMRPWGQGGYPYPPGAYGMAGGHGGRGAVHAAAKMVHRPVAHVVQNAHARCANGFCGAGAVGPEQGAVTYPYYTTRGPRDFFLKNPASIGP